MGSCNISCYRTFVDLRCLDSAVRRSSVRVVYDQNLGALQGFSQGCCRRLTACQLAQVLKFVDHIRIRSVPDSLECNYVDLLSRGIGPAANLNIDVGSFGYCGREDISELDHIRCDGYCG